MSRWMIVVVLLVACKREPPSQPPAPGSGSPAAAPIAIDAPAPDAAPQRPTEAQALDAAKAWIAAVIANKPALLVAASDLPFQFVDAFNRKSCGAGPFDDAKELEALLPCFAKNEGKVAATFGEETKLEFSVDIPEPPATLVGRIDDWNGVMPEAQRGEHVFVTFAHGHPEYWSDVLYALFAVRIVDGVPKVGGVALLVSQEGD